MNCIDSDIHLLVGKATNITAFQRSVYLALIDVPQGRTITYKGLGELVSCRSAQAIGQALRRNPFAVGCPVLPEYTHVPSGLTHFTLDFCVPCHRVIASNGTIGGFCGEVEGEQIDRKRKLLLEEGVRVHPDSNDLFAFTQF